MTNTMKTFIIVFGLVSFANLFTVGQAKSIKAACSIQINNDLPEPQPLLLKPGGSTDGNGFFLPQGADGNFTVAAGQQVLLACPGANNGFKNATIGTPTAVATCNSGTTFDFNSVNYNFSDFACKSYPVHNATAFGQKCYDQTNRYINISIGFQVQSHFYKLIDICFDNILYTTLYAKETIVSGIAGFQQNFTSPNFKPDTFFTNMSVNNLYTRNTQRQTISNILGSTQLGNHYINNTSNYFLAKGHLSAKTDFVYGSQQRATFHYVNAAPQWQTFNGGNWKELEESVRTYADTKKLNLDVYTGTYGILTFPDVNGIETELYLYVNINNSKAIPVPKLYWKAVYDPKSQAGVVVVGINNPYESNPKGDYRICDDVCSKITWLQWNQTDIEKGFSYCCEVDKFRKKVNNILPQFTVTGLLT